MFGPNESIFKSSNPMFCVALDQVTFQVDSTLLKSNDVLGILLGRSHQSRAHLEPEVSRARLNGAKFGCIPPVNPVLLPCTVCVPVQIGNPATTAVPVTTQAPLPTSTASWTQTATTELATQTRTATGTPTLTKTARSTSETQTSSSTSFTTSSTAKHPALPARLPARPADQPLRLLPHSHHLRPSPEPQPVCTRVSFLPSASNPLPIANSSYPESDKDLCRCRHLHR